MYHLFGRDRYYPNGGMGDYLDSFDTIGEAKERARAEYHDWFDIVIQREGDHINPARLIILESGNSRWLPSGEFTIMWEEVSP